MDPLIVIAATFLVSLIILLKSADIFTFSAEKIGIKLGISEFIIGITIVSIGTSLPELATSIVATLNNKTPIVVGNVLGSNLSNILLILGISALFIRNTRFNINLLNIDLPVLFSSILLIAFLSYDLEFSWLDGIIVLLGYLFYMEYVYHSRKEIDDNLEKLIEKRKNIKLKWEIPKLLISLALIYLSSQYVVKSLISLARMVNISESIISATTLALGTSLPELIVAIQASRKKKFDMVIGDILGSNIFNTFVIMGVNSLILPLMFDAFAFKLLLPYTIGSTLLFFMMTQDQEISKYEGYMLILLYIAYLLAVINWININGG